MAGELGREVFAQRVGQTLAVASAEQSSVPLRVDRVEDYGEGTGQRFSLFLVGPADRPLRQGTHLVEGDGIDAFDLFVVPVGRTDDGIEYEAAFNRA